MVTVSKPTAAAASSSDTLVLPAWPSSQPPAGFWLAHIFNAVMFYVCAKSAYDFQDATRAMAFYGVYHREPWNQVIHFFGVPFILWTMLVGAAHLPLFAVDPVIDFLPLVPPHHVSWATLWAALYTVFYLSIDATGALLFAPLLYTMYATAIRWTRQDQQTYLNTMNQHGKQQQQQQPHWMGTGRLLRAAVVLHFLSWYVQIHPGHKIIEGAQPASLANLGGALTTAPLFAFSEGVWFVGFRQDFQAKVVAQVEVYTRQLCEQGADMRVCATL